VLYTFAGGFWAVLVVPSPKSHAQVAIVPVEEFVNATLNGAVPLVGVIVKFASGGAALTLMGVVAVSVSAPPGPVAVSLTV
jgi:hypothetical protein